MKKILIVSIAVVLCCVMLIPASAEVVEYDTLNLPPMPEYNQEQYPYITVMRLSVGTFFYVTDKEFSVSSSEKYNITNAQGLGYYLTNGEWSLDGFNNGSGIFTKIIWANYDIKYSNGNIFHESNAPKPCDGTTCPATDLNTDNICDDCGAMFAVLRDYTPSDFPSGYPSVPSLNMPDANYYLYKVNSTDREYLVVYPSAVTPTYDTTKQNGYLYFSESYGSYELNKTTNEWELSNDESPYFIGGTNNNSVDIKYSSDTIYDQNGDTFFPIPLWMEMEQVTQGEMKLFNPTMVGILTTLMVCGVGCLALLVVLKLFGNRSLISRN